MMVVLRAEREKEDRGERRVEGDGKEDTQEDVV